jgi:hypothetical protein
MSAQAAADPDKIDPKIAARFVWKPGDITITNPDGTSSYQGGKP